MSEWCTERDEKLDEAHQEIVHLHEQIERYRDFAYEVANSTSPKLKALAEAVLGERKETAVERQERWLRRELETYRKLIAAAERDKIAPPAPEIDDDVPF